MNVATRELEPVAPELLEALAHVDVCTATALLQKQGFMHTYAMGVGQLASRADGRRMVGRALTLRFIPLRETLLNDAEESSPHRQALEMVGPGDVLVVDAGGSLEAAVAGDIFTRRIMNRGGQGLVVDGVLRDVAVIRSIGLPVYGKGIHGAGIGRALMSVGVNEPIRCGGVPVLPGDIILGDEDGVVVIPPAAAAKVVEEGLHKAELEEFIRERIAAGASLHTHYPPDAEALREYEAWRQARAARG